LVTNTYSRFEKLLSTINEFTRQFDRIHAQIGARKSRISFEEINIHLSDIDALENWYKYEAGNYNLMILIEIVTN